MLSETGHMITPWKTIEDAVPFNASGNPGFIVGKACYWLDDQTLRLPMMMRILCLDLDSETFYIVDYPAPESYENKHDMHIGELKGKLFMTDTFPNMLKMDIWERENGKYSNWEMKYCIDLSLIDGFDDVFSELKLIGYISEGDQDEMLMFQNSEENEVFYYDVEAKTFKEGHQLEVGNSIDSMIFPYTEKFSSIRRPAERID
ncbi:hypothetical protein POM88_041821 [Heracleum sosnowskyi]|nr:hypothetical protein POM88_041821 [Heracleum sosnowskyi]